MTAAYASIDSFLGVFFGPGNDLRLDAGAGASPIALSLRPWVERLRANPPRFTVLPRQRAGFLEYYAVAFDTGELQLMAEDLQGFLGATWIHLLGARGTLDQADPIDTAIAALSGLKILRFTVPNNPLCRREAGRALRLMRQAWERREALRADIGPLQRPVGRLLRDFYMALRATNREAAEGQLSQLQTQGILDPVNILFLRVQMLAELELWTELLSIDHLPQLAIMRRPPAVTEAVLTAIYHEHIVGLTPTARPEDLLAAFRNRRVSAAYAGWLTTAAGIHRPEALLILLFHLVSHSPAKIEQARLLLAQVHAETLLAPEFSYLQGLVEGSPVSASATDALAAARSMAAAGDWDGAAAFAKSAPDSYGRTCLLYECAASLQTLEHYRLAAESLSNLSAAERERFRASPAYRILAESLDRDMLAGAAGVQRTEDIPPASWSEWLKRLNKGGPWRGASDQARAGATEWTVGTFLGNETMIQTFVDALGASRPAEADRVLDHAMPHLLHTLQTDAQYPRLEYRPIYQRLIEILLLQTEGGRDDLAVLLDLLEAILSLGLAPGEYGLLLSDLSDLFSRIAAPTVLDSALDQLDVIARMPCQAPTKREEFISAVSTWCITHPRRITATQWRWLAAICEELGLVHIATTLQSKSVTDSGGELVRQALDGKLIAIYTLTETVGCHLGRRLQQLFPGVRIELAHDLVASDRLRHLARTADLFIMFTRSAKHAATDCIRQARPRQFPLMMPTGRGISGVLQDIRRTIP